MWEFLDKAIYINLDHRQDRRQNMEKFFKDASIPDSKVVRFSAIRHPVGMVGCGKSHIGALKLALQNNWGNILILEDDMEWIDFEQNYPKLEEVLQSNWDVCMLTGRYLDMDPPKIKMALHTNAYIVKKEYISTLLANFEEGQKILTTPKLSFMPKDIRKETMMKDHFHHIDVYWCKLQHKDNWVGMYPQMCQQIMTYSDINGQVMQVLNSYGDENGIFKQYILDRLV